MMAVPDHCAVHEVRPRRVWPDAIRDVLAPGVLRPGDFPVMPSTDVLLRPLNMAANPQAHQLSLEGCKKSAFDAKVGPAPSSPAPAHAPNVALPPPLPASLASPPTPPKSNSAPPLQNTPHCSGLRARTPHTLGSWTEPRRRRRAEPEGLDMAGDDQVPDLPVRGLRAL